MLRKLTENDTDICQVSEGPVRAPRVERRCPWGSTAGGDGVDGAVGAGRTGFGRERAEVLNG